MDLGEDVGDDYEEHNDSYDEDNRKEEGTGDIEESEKNYRQMATMDRK